MPRACMTDQYPSRGGGGGAENFWPMGLSLSQCRHVFCEYGQIYMYRAYIVQPQNYV